MTEEPTIFVVDDDENCRESMCALVTAKGFHAESFCSGEEFLASPKSRSKSGCLITDYKMSGMTGLDLQRKLSEQNSYLPVIVVSGHASVSVAVEVMTAGAITLLEKPHTEDDLMGAIDKAVHRAEKQRTQRERRDNVRKAWEGMSEEEQEIARMLVAGFANKVVASKQNMGLRTAERRRSEILKAMGVRTVPQLAQLLTVLEGEFAPVA